MTTDIEIKDEKLSVKAGQYKILTIIFIALLFFILPIASLQVGIPGDDPIDAQYGIESLKFYKSFGADTSFTNLTVMNDQTFPYQKYYGALFEAISVELAQIIGTPIYKTRHVLIALCGAIIILFTALFTAELFGWLTALIAVILLESSTTFIGNSYFNSKDIPMAMGFIIAFYFFIRLLKQLPLFHISTIIGCIAGIALTIGIRMGGLILIGYLVAFLLYFIADQDSIRKQLFITVKSIFKLCLIIVFIIFSGILLGCLCYPNFFLHGFLHITEAMAVAKSFPVKIVMLFKGELIYANEITWNYLPISMGITFPLTVLAGIFIFYLLLYVRRKIFSWQDFILVYSVLFLIVYAITTHLLMYNGWRHVMFIYPVIISSAAIGFTRFFTYLKIMTLRVLVIILFSIMTIKTVAWMVVNHPYEYIYFNEIQGGVKGAYGNYDTDYQQLASSESLQWLLNSPVYKNDTATNKILLTNNIALMCDERVIKDEFEVRSSSYLKISYRPMNYAILSSIYLDKNIMTNFFPPKGEIHSVKVDGVPISVVLNRENDFLVKGKFYFDNTQLDSAFYYLLKAYDYDKNDYRIWPPLSHCYFLKGNLNQAFEIIKRYLHFFPEDEMAFQEFEMIKHSIDSLNQTIQHR